jgi:hypothetical protein
MLHSVQPKFCQLPVNLKQKLNKDEIYKIQQRNLKDEFKNQKNLLSLLENSFNNLKIDHKKTTKNNFEYEENIKNVKNDIFHSEAGNDKKRERNDKFDK